MNSIFLASLRALCVTFFAVVGLFLAFVPIALIYSSIESSEDALSTDYNVKILPNAEGVRKKESKSAPVILQIDVTGLVGLESLSQDAIRKMLVESREGTLKNDRVKAILLNCNTPGGAMIDADGIYRALKEYKERYKVPVFAYVDGLLASGGMYIGAAADEIHASNVSLIGSVGVITPAFFNVSKLTDKLGIDSITLFAGKGKDDLNPMRPWKPGEEDNLKDVIDYYYHSFVDLVLASRPKMNRTLLVEKLGANIYPAEQALQYGFIDNINATRSSTLKKLLAKIGIEDNYYQVVQLESSSWFAQLFQSESPLLTGQIKHQIGMGNELPSKLTNQILYLYRP